MKKSAVEINCTIFLVLACLFLVAFDFRHHEFWRDEVHPVLIARADSLEELFTTMRVEGVPPLPFLLSKVLDALFRPPLSLAIYGGLGYAALLGGTYLTSFAWSRRRRASLIVTVAFAMTDAFAHEYGVIVRQYGLGLGFALATFGLLAQSIELPDKKKEAWAAAFASLAVLTSAHPGCLAGSALFSFALVRTLRTRSVRGLWPAVSALPAFAVTFWIISPYANRTPEASRSDPLPAHLFEQVASIYQNTVACQGWWGTAPPDGVKDWLAATALLAMGLALVMAIVDAAKPAFLAYALSALALNFAAVAYIDLTHFQGAYRHNLGFLLPILVSTAAVAATGSTARALRVVMLRQWPILLLIPWFVYQYHGLYVDLSRDSDELFSQTKSTAMALPQNATIVSDHDTASIGMLYWRPDLRFRSADGAGRAVRHIVADHSWHQRVDVEPLLREECDASHANVFFTTHDAQSVTAAIKPCAAIFEPRGHALLDTETFDTWKIDCDCMRQSR